MLAARGRQTCRRRCAALVVIGLLAATDCVAVAQSAPHPGLETIAAATPEDRAAWDRRISAMLRAGELKLREQRQGSGAGERDEWFTQLFKGVPVEGTEVWRRVARRAAIAIEGVVYKDIVVNPVPKLTRAEAIAALAALAPGTLGPSLPPALVILATADGKYALVYKSRLLIGGDLVTYYLDSDGGANSALGNGRLTTTKPAKATPGSPSPAFVNTFSGPRSDLMPSWRGSAPIATENSIMPSPARHTPPTSTTAMSCTVTSPCC